MSKQFELKDLQVGDVITQYLGNQKIFIAQITQFSSIEQPVGKILTLDPYNLNPDQIGLETYLAIKDKSNYLGFTTEEDYEYFGELRTKHLIGLD